MKAHLYILCRIDASVGHAKSDRHPDANSLNKLFRTGDYTDNRIRAMLPRDGYAVRIRVFHAPGL